MWCGRCRVDFKWDAKKRDVLGTLRVASGSRQVPTRCCGSFSLTPTARARSTGHSPCCQGAKKTKRPLDLTRDLTPQVLLHPSFTMTIDTSAITGSMGFPSMPYAAGAFPSRVEVRSHNTTVCTPKPGTSSKIPRPTNLRLITSGPFSKKILVPHMLQVCIK